MAKQNIKDPGAHHNSSGALIRRFLPYLAKHKAVLFLDLFCAALTTLCDIFLPKIMSTISKATSKGVYHKNNCARKISRLSKAVNSIA